VDYIWYNHPIIMPFKTKRKSQPTFDVQTEIRKIGVFIEQQSDHMDLVVEQYGDIKNALDEHGRLLEAHNEMLGNLAIDITIVKEDIEFIKNGMKKKVDLEEFIALERRVLLLEKKR
jgi:hypothetical protein